MEPIQHYMIYTAMRDVHSGRISNPHSAMYFAVGFSLLQFGRGFANLLVSRGGDLEKSQSAHFDLACRSNTRCTDALRIRDVYFLFQLQSAPKTSKNHQTPKLLTRIL